MIARWVEAARSAKWRNSNTCRRGPTGREPPPRARPTGRVFFHFRFPACPRAALPHLSVPSLPRGDREPNQPGRLTCPPRPQIHTSTPPRSLPPSPAQPRRHGTNHSRSQLPIQPDEAVPSHGDLVAAWLIGSGRRRGAARVAEMGYLPSLGGKAAHLVSDLATVILNPVSEREPSSHHLPVSTPSLCRFRLDTHPPNCLFLSISASVVISRPIIRVYLNVAGGDGISILLDYAADSVLPVRLRIGMFQAVTSLR
jgi:hypothetical protein